MDDEIKILFAGEPHTGKSTLLDNIVQEIHDKQGFITKELLKDGERVGFELVAANGDRVTFAHVDFTGPNKVSKYFIDVDALDKFIEPLFDYDQKTLLYVDEIGEMQLKSTKFKQLVQDYLDSGHNFIGTISSVYENAFTYDCKLRDDIGIIEIGPANRDKLVGRFIKLLG